MNRDERRRLEASYPQCPCGNTAQKDSSPPRCGRCAEVDETRDWHATLRERVERAESIDDLREAVLYLLNRSQP